MVAITHTQEQNNKIRIITKQGEYGGWIVKGKELEKIKSKVYEGMEVEAYEYELNKIEVLRYGEWEKINYITASGSGIAIEKARVYFKRRKVRMKIKKINDYYIVLDLTSFGEWEDYKNMELIAFGGRYSSLEKIKYAILEMGWVKEWNDEFSTGRLELFKNWWTGYYTEDKEILELLKNTVSAGGRAIILEFEEQKVNEEKEELKEVIEELGKMVEKYGEEKMRKAISKLFNLN